MNDFIIKSGRVKKELLMLGISFLTAFILNMYAILKYNGEFIELISQLHIVFILSLALYFFFVLMRLIFIPFRYFFLKIFSRKMRPGNS